MQEPSPTAEFKESETAAAEEVASPATEGDKTEDTMPATLKKSQEGLKKEEEVSFWISVCLLELFLS